MGLECQTHHHGGKHVEPEDARHDHFFEHEHREMLEWDGVICTAHPFLDGLDEMLNFGNMFIIGTSIQARARTL